MISLQYKIYRYKYLITKSIPYSLTEKLIGLCLCFIVILFGNIKQSKWEKNQKCYRKNEKTKNTHKPKSKDKKAQSGPRVCYWWWSYIPQIHHTACKLHAYVLTFLISFIFRTNKCCIVSLLLFKEFKNRTNFTRKTYF